MSRPKMGEKVKKIKEWLLGLVLLAASPFLLLVFILVSISIKLPIWIFMLYNEFWYEMKNKKNERTD